MVFNRAVITELYYNSNRIVVGKHIAISPSVSNNVVRLNYYVTTLGYETEVDNMLGLLTVNIFTPSLISDVITRRTGLSNYASILKLISNGIVTAFIGRNVKVTAKEYEGIAFVYRSFHNQLVCLDVGLGIKRTMSIDGLNKLACFRMSEKENSSYTIIAFAPTIGLNFGSFGEPILLCRYEIKLSMIVNKRKTLGIAGSFSREVKHGIIR